ncbi:MarR family transcriptional regulator [Rhizobium sp. 18065]|uniref:MarR family winged helix-turn-helix transcriptional regulator n=1 Tax=Rhizobium sp. 18065 TaxID=2681411 RepID=UPI001357F054|nr:MarR family transcriptional regulator [Rhizobium sp. 18065]
MSTSCYCITLRKASRRLTSIYDEAMAPLGVNISQFSQLRNIKRAQPVSLTDLAKRLELDRSTVGRNTKLLERMGLVSSEPGEDLRENALVLTEQGEKLVEDGAPLWDEVQERLEQKLGTSDIGKLVVALNSL